MTRAILRAILIAAIVACGIAAWLAGARSGYEVGAMEAGRTGYLDGYHAAAADQRAKCRPWFTDAQLEKRRGGTAICAGVY